MDENMSSHGDAQPEIRPVDMSKLMDDESFKKLLRKHVCDVLEEPAVQERARKQLCTCCSVRLNAMIIWVMC